MNNEMRPQKDPLKIGAGEVVKIKLTSNTPFKEGINTWDGIDKPWFGYNVTKGSEEFAYFASEAVHKLFQAAKPEGEFILELRAVKNKEGQSRSIWHLDGKNLWKYEEEMQTTNIPGVELTPEKVVDINPVGGRGPDPSGDKWKYDVIERLEKLEKELYNNTMKTDDDVPF